MRIKDEEDEEEEKRINTEEIQQMRSNISKDIMINVGNLGRNSTTK